MDQLFAKKEDEIFELIADVMQCERDNLFRYGFYRLGSTSDTEDMLQELFIKLCNRSIVAIPDDRVELKCYIFRSMQNACNDILRHRSRVPHVAIEKLKDITTEELSPQNSADEFRLINRLFSTLPPEQSEALRLRIYSECSFQEIADIMQVPITTAKSRFKYGIEKLRKELIHSTFFNN